MMLLVVRFAFVATVLAAPLWAEEKPATPPPPANPDNKKPDDPAPGAEDPKAGPRDPFADTQRIRRQYERREVLTPNGEVIRQPVAISETVPGFAMPRMSLLGCVQKKDSPAIALLQVEDREYFVIKPGDTVNVNQNGHAIQLKVKSIDGLSAVLEVVGEGQVITVR